MQCYVYHHDDLASFLVEILGSNRRNESDHRRQSRTKCRRSLPRNNRLQLTGFSINSRSRETERRMRSGFVEIVERRRRRQRRAWDRMPARKSRTSGPALRKLLSANGRRGIWHRLDDLLWTGIRPVLRAGTEHQMSQHNAGPHARHQNGLHLHPNVLHIPEQWGEWALWMTATRAVLTTRDLSFNDKLDF